MARGSAVSFDESLQHAKRLVKIVFGFTMLLLGVIMLVTPGPGVATIVFGLAVLAAEFVWAQRLLNRIKAQGHRLKAELKEEGNRLRQMVMPPEPKS
jgi:uncharacterized protein (TIGR02611 family)